MRPLAIVLVLLGGMTPVFASGSLLQQPPGAPGTKRRVDPYAKLFQPQSIERTARAQERLRAATASTAPRVVCGMTLIPAPNVDPRIVIEPRTDSTRYTIRAIDPPICNSAPPDR